MTTAPTFSPTPAMPGASNDARRRRSLWLIILLVFAAQIVLYRNSFSLLPVNDHFGPPLSEIWRGKAQGPLVFFTRSAQISNYRPLQSLTMWLFGSISRAHVYFWIRVMNFVGMALYAVALGLWLTSLPVGVGAIAVAVIVFFIHPAVTLPLASIDGLAGLYCSAALWIGTWFALRYAREPLKAVPLALVCFIIGVGYKEYAFGMVPLAPLAAIVFGGRRGWRTAVALGLVLGAALLGVLAVRKLTVPPGMSQGYGYVNIRPAHLVENAVILATGLLFMGNSIWVFVHRSLPVVALITLSMIAVVAAIGIGITERVRADKPGTADGAGGREGQATGLKWTIFLVLSLIPASFPANIIFHVSEMYVLPLILPFALLCALAVDGLLRRRGWRLWAGTALALACLIFSVDAVQAKIVGLRQSGENAQHMLQELSAVLPPNMQDKRLALLFRSRDLPPRRTYSILRVGDEELLSNQQFAMEFVRPGQGLKFDQFVVNDFSDPVPPGYDLVLGWDAANRKWIPLAGFGAGSAASRTRP